MAMGKGYSLLCPFFLVLLIRVLQASHHEWDEATLSTLRVSKSSSPAPREAYRTANFNHGLPVTNVSDRACLMGVSANYSQDPNAPLFYKGYYHLFYQYNPKSAVWGRIVWGHAVSTDLINWRHMTGAAIYPDEWYDANGAWSGSATFLHKGGPPVILYTGSNNASEQVQVMAVPKNPSDPLLREWKKIAQNPIMVPIGINVSSFRDPTTAWLGSDQRWRVLVGSKSDENKVGMALMFRSKDFVKWVKAKHPLHSARHTGMWECPDFYPVSLYGSHGVDTSTTGPSVKHVLKNSLDDNKVDYYTVGHYSPELDRYVPDDGSVEGHNGLRYDYGKFYASKTFFDDNKSRRILWGWINESDSVADDLNKGWASLQAIPRVVQLDPLTRRSLIQWPVPELESLHEHNIRKDHVVLERESVMKVEGFNSGAAQVDVEVEFELESDYETEEELEAMTATAQSLCSRGGNNNTRGFGLMVLASDDLKERSAVFFKIFKGRVSGNVHRKVALCVDQSRSTLQVNVDKTSYGGFVSVKPDQRSLSLRVLVDHSIVESFAEGGRTCITSRSYPTVAVNENARLFVFNYNKLPLVLRRLSAWHMNSTIQIYESN